jgi:hypothetical protein
MNWYHDPDGLWRLRDEAGRHRAGVSFTRGWDNVPSHWQWTAFPIDYDRYRPDTARTGVDEDLETAKTQAEAAAKVL